MNNTAESNDILQKLCAGQSLAVLATDAGSSTCASLVAVAITPDLLLPLGIVLFALPRVDPAFDLSLLQAWIVTCGFEAGCSQPTE